MEIWQFVVGLVSLVVTVALTIGGMTWRFAWQITGIRDGLLKSIDDKAGGLQKAIEEKTTGLQNQFLNGNNSMLARLQLSEDNLEGKLESIYEKFDARTLGIERDLANFKAYCERQFMSKETFHVVMQSQSSERNVMKGEIVERLNRIDGHLDSLKGNGGITR